jgi:hypothetical protein
MWRDSDEVVGEVPRVMVGHPCPKRSYQETDRCSVDRALERLGDDGGRPRA